MKFFTIATALLASATSVMSAPVTENELVVRGKKDYSETSQVIIAKTYVTTETEILYSAHGSSGSSDYSVLVVSIYPANHQTFYADITVDINISVVVIDKDTVYFKSKQPTEYVASTCGKYSFDYTSYPKGLLPILRADSRSISLDLVL